MPDAIGRSVIFYDQHFGDTPDEYGCFRINRETRTRWYFEHVCGSKQDRDGYSRTGSAFNYHNELWLDKEAAVLRAKAWIPDEDTFEPIVEALRRLEKFLEEAEWSWRTRADLIRKNHIKAISNMIADPPSAE